MKTICALTGAYEIINDRHLVETHRSKYLFALKTYYFPISDIYFL